MFKTWLYLLCNTEQKQKPVLFSIESIVKPPRLSLLGIAAGCTGHCKMANLVTPHEGRSLVHGKRKETGIGGN